MTASERLKLDTLAAAWRGFDSFDVDAVLERTGLDERTATFEDARAALAALPPAPHGQLPKESRP